jgi:hypothetical protein
VDYRSRSRDTAKGSLGSSEGNWLALKMSLHAPFKTKYLIQNKRNIFPFRLNLRGRFDVYERPIFYLELNFTPKFGTRIYRNTSEHKVAVEVPKDLVRRKRSEFLNATVREKTIALNLARGAAVRTFSDEARYDEDAIWCDSRPSVMNERPCNHEENGTRAWRIT